MRMSEHGTRSGTAAAALRAYRPQRDGVAQGEMITRYAPLVKRVVDRLPIYLPPTLDSEDLLGYGTVGLIEAINRYDASAGVPFEAYATARIRGAVLDALRAQSWMPRATRDRVRDIAAAAANVQTEQGRPASEAELAAATNLNPAQLRAAAAAAGRTVVSLERPLQAGGEEPLLLKDILADPHAEDPATAATRADLLERLARALEELPERDRTLLSLYYVEDLTMREIAEVLRITVGRVCQLHTRALRRLRDILEPPDGKRARGGAA